MIKIFYLIVNLIWEKIFEVGKKYILSDYEYRYLKCFV